MGSTYANATVAGADLGEVLAVLSGTGALVHHDPRAITVFAPLDDEDDFGQGTTAARLSAALRMPTLDVAVHDDDLCQLQVFVDGGLAAVAIAPPGALGDDGEEEPGRAERTAMLASFGELGELPLTARGAIAPATEADDASRLVAALERGDLGALRAALAVDHVFASRAHAQVLDALDLPDVGVGWGHRYLSADPSLFTAGTLLRA